MIEIIEDAGTPAPGGSVAALVGLLDKIASAKSGAREARAELVREGAKCRPHEIVDAVLEGYALDGLDHRLREVRKRYARLGLSARADCR